MRLALATARFSDARNIAGYQVNTAPYFAMTDVFLQPSAYDAAPIAVIEAMLAGLPVIATTVGGIPDVASKDETALLVAPGDVPALAAAMARLAGDEALRARLGLAGAARAQAHFSKARYIADIDSLYREMLGR